MDKKLKRIIATEAIQKVLSINFILSVYTLYIF